MGSRSRGEAWKRRIGDYDEHLFDKLGEARMWVNVGDRKKTVAPTIDDENRADTPGSATSDITVSTDSSESHNKPSFNSLTPGKKFKLIKTISKPQNTQYNKDGTISLLISTKEANNLIGDRAIVDPVIGNFEVIVTNNTYKNRVRGIIRHEVISNSPKEEIIESLEEFG